MPLPSAPPADALQAAILTLLPEDGTPVLNRVMRVMLARRLGKNVDEETFFAARDALMLEGLVGRLRGQGGQLYLTKPTPEKVSTEPPAKEKREWSEAKLMEPLRRFLEGPFRKSLDLPANAACIIQDTSVMGPHRGKWARPDFILVSAMTYRLMPGAQVDLHSFELKTETGGSVLAIHEALAQTRWTHFGHFVWHLPLGSKSEALLGDITTHCEEHGIGLILLRDPKHSDEPGGYEFVLDPRRKATQNIDIEDFLMSRLSDTQKEELVRAARGNE